MHNERNSLLIRNWYSILAPHVKYSCMALIPLTIIKRQNYDAYCTIFKIILCYGGENVESAARLTRRKWKTGVLV